MQAVKRMSTIVSGKTSQTSTPRAPVTPQASQTLASFLTESKRQFLENSSKLEASQWTVSMGNEAGDLDTIASSIGFAWIQSIVNQKPTVPFMQFERADVKLRNENIYALELAGIKADSPELFCADDVPSSILIASKFALVDHNRLGGTFLRNNPQSEVTAVVDHHEDEGLYKDTANPRLIQSSGSCASHIALLCPNEIPSELATLLLCAVTIDTDGLKPGGKAEEVDRKAAAFLLKRSIYAKSASTTSDTPVDGVSNVPDDGTTIHDLPLIKKLATTLAAKKDDVNSLAALDLIRRDFKKYSYVPAWDPEVVVLNAGISTVPRKLKQWIGPDGGEVATAAKTWMESNDLHVLCIATSFRQQAAVEKLTPGKRKGKHARELLFIVRTPSSKLSVDTLANRLFTGIEGNPELKANIYKQLNTDKALGSALPKEMRYRVYKQGDASLNRKFLAPLVKEILEGKAGDNDAGAEVAQGVSTVGTASSGVVLPAVA